MQRPGEGGGRGKQGHASKRVDLFECEAFPNVSVCKEGKVCRVTTTRCVDVVVSLLGWTEGGMESFLYGTVC